MLLLVAAAAYAESRFVWVPDIHADSRAVSRGACSNRPYAQDARIWSITWSLELRDERLRPMTGLGQTPAYVDVSTGALYVLMMDGPRTIEVKGLSLAEIDGAAATLRRRARGWTTRTVRLYRVPGLAGEAAEETYLRAFGDGAPRGLEAVESFTVASPEVDEDLVRRMKRSVDSLMRTGPKGPDGPPVFAVDEPCLGFGVTPALDGGGETMATTFHARYDVYSVGGRRFLKLRGSGDSDAAAGTFQRGDVAVEAGTNNRGLVRWAVAGIGGYSFAGMGAARADEWRTGGKLQLWLPALVLHGRAGSMSRPLLRVEGGLVGSGASTRSFYLRSAGEYTVRPAPKLAVDLRAMAGNTAEGSLFANTRVQFRYQLSGDYDLIARYDCGRRSPDYLKSCGWQTGFALITGR